MCDDEGPDGVDRVGMPFKAGGDSFRKGRGMSHVFHTLGGVDRLRVRLNVTVLGEFSDPDAPRSGVGWSRKQREKLEEANTGHTPVNM